MAGWHPFSLISDSSKVICLLLNSPTARNRQREVLAQVWNASKLRVAVDGGLNALFQAKEEWREPEIVCGDFDSAGKEALDFYRGKEGVHVIETPDQDYIDFTKALMLLKERKCQAEAIFAIGETGGRLDQVFNGIQVNNYDDSLQIMANIETLFRAPDIVNCPVFLLSSTGIAWILKADFQHNIEIPKDMSEVRAGMTN